MSGRLVRARAQKQGKRRDDRGAAALEFALVTPMLFALLFGIIAYGYMLSFRQGISQGAAEGARAAAVSVAVDKGSDARDALNQSLGAYGVSCGVDGTLSKDGANVGTCATSIDPCTNNANKQCASVRVSYAYRDHPLLPSFPGLGVTLPRNLEYTAVARVS